MKNHIRGFDCELVYYPDGEYETQELEAEKNYEITLKIKAEFLGFDRNELMFQYMNQDVAIQADHILEIKEVSKE